MAEHALERSAKYFLSNHVFLCVDEGRAIFLDLRKDVYLALEADQAASLSTLVRGWPSPGRSLACKPSRIDNSSDSLIQLLLDRGLITTNAESGKSAAPVAVEEPKSELGVDWAGDDTPIRVWDVLTFMLALLVAFIGIRLLHIERTVVRVRSRNERYRATAVPADMEHLRRLVFTFVRLRPLAFTSRDACLFESLALLEFLSYRNIYPTWVFAVQARPFAAHCWLQYGSVVLNDSVEHARSFMPIMTV